MTVEDEGRFDAAGARHDASDCGVVFATAPSHIPVRTEHYHAASSDVAVVRRECFGVVGTVENQVVSGGDLDVALGLNCSDELSCECAADSDDPCAVGAGSPNTGLVFALPDDTRAALVGTDDGAVIGRMPHTPDSLTLCTLPENALPRAKVATDDGAVIGRMPHTPDSLALYALPENALPRALVGTDDAAVIGRMRRTPDSLALCTIPKNCWT